MTQNLSAAQCRAARALLGWSQPDLAKKARVNISTIQDVENDRREPRAGTVVLLVQAFEAAGIKFIDGEEGVGVLLAKRKRTKA